MVFIWSELRLMWKSIPSWFGSLSPIEQLWFFDWTSGHWVSVKFGFYASTDPCLICSFCMRFSGRSTKRWISRSALSTSSRFFRSSFLNFFPFLTGRMCFGWFPFSEQWFFGGLQVWFSLVGWAHVDPTHHPEILHSDSRHYNIFVGFSWLIKS